ncbi:MAG: YciI family protein [Gaiellales bacterium]
MEYVALIHAAEDEWEALGEAGQRETLAEYSSLAADARAAGVLVDGDELAPTAVATSVRLRDGELLVTDGPYAEVKEALGGFFIFSCGSLDEALDWASRIPAARTGAVEVRPVHVEGVD